MSTITVVIKILVFAEMWLLSYPYERHQVRQRRASIKLVRRLQPLDVMSSSSPFIKRAKGRSNIRQRDESAPGSPLVGSGDQAGPGDEDDDVGMSPMMMAKNRKKEKEKKKSGTFGKTRLSFGGEEEVSQSDRQHLSGPAHIDLAVPQQGVEDQPFVARKSKLSQSISLQKAATTASASALAGSSSSDYHNPFAASSSTPAAPPSVSYNNAYLEELKASTPTKAPRRDDDNEPMEVDDVPTDADSSILPPISSRYAPVLDTTQGIPDEAAIAAAKAKRKTALGTGVSSSSGMGGEDYISVNQDNGKLSVYDADARGDLGPHPESRLQREEDEEGDGDAGSFDVGTMLRSGPANKAMRASRSGGIYRIQYQTCVG
jgi:GC-rich sequence DNA-binding factor